MFTPDFELAKIRANGSKVVPIALELFSDQKTSIEILNNIKSQSDNWYILESVNGNDSWGRYTFIGYNPVAKVYGENGKVFYEKNGVKTEKSSDALGVIRHLLSEYESSQTPGLPPFTGGFVGYFTYDFVQSLIKGLTLNAKNDGDFHDFHLMLMDKVIVIDHFKQKIFIIANVKSEEIETGYGKAKAELKEIANLILTSAAPVKFDPDSRLDSELTPRFDLEEFSQAVLTVKEHIRQGDIFQAVISNRFTAPFKGNLMNAYRILRTSNPSPYMVYMRLDDVEIACSSPETLAALRGREISSFPLAGSRPRGRDDKQDEELIRELLSDEKELAEHDMLVDLARNDIGKISRFGTVKVRDYRVVKKFSHIMHISSRVTGEINDGADALDLIAAALPAGTLSGAPKKRACEIIDKTEGVRRGIYGGAIGYIDFTGNMDMCIGIRTAVLNKGTVYVQSGAGIVADSVPESEYAESRNKARAIINALNNTGGDF
jgi:anthranilate synthase component 1